MGGESDQATSWSSPLPRSNGPPKVATVGDVVGGLKAIVATFQEEPPGATIVLTGLYPRPRNKELAPDIRRINEQLAALADGKKIRFLNINNRLTDDRGELLPGISGDGVHLEEKGYDVWAQELKPIITELLGPARGTDHAPPPTGDPSGRQQASPGGRD